MKFVVSSTVLLSHLQAISRVINSKNSLPILDNFLLNLEGKTLTMTASDIETTLITSLEVDNAEGSGKGGRKTYTKRDSVVDKIIANVYVIRNGDNRVLVFYIFI
jgi:DNA polymerase III sliding clamp (beta) subunit (PCNA family)